MRRRTREERGLVPVVPDELKTFRESDGWPGEWKSRRFQAWADARAEWEAANLPEDGPDLHDLYPLPDGPFDPRDI